MCIHVHMHTIASKRIYILIIKLACAYIHAHIYAHAHICMHNYNIYN